MNSEKAPKYLAADDPNAEYWWPCRSIEEAKVIAADQEWAELWMDDAVKPVASQHMPFLSNWLEDLNENAGDDTGSGNDVFKFSPGDIERLNDYLARWVDEHAVVQFWITAGKARKVE